MSSIWLILLISFCVDFSACRPSEEPTKFDLSVDARDAKTAGQSSPSRIAQGQELFGRISDGVRIGMGKLVNSITLARNNIFERMELLASEARNNVASVIASRTNFFERKRSVAWPTPTTTKPRETVVLESASAQGILEKPLPNPLDKQLGLLARPTPIVDGIREEDKYGNNGDKFNGVGRALVNGFEGLSNFLNTLVGFPRNSAKDAWNGISEKLNQIGGRIVGLV